MKDIYISYMLMGILVHIIKEDANDKLCASR